MGTSMICEQGDLGLWNEQLNDKDQKVYNEAVARENESKNTQIINENKDKKN